MRFCTRAAFRVQILNFQSSGRCHRYLALLIQRAPKRQQSDLPRQAISGCWAIKPSVPLRQNTLLPPLSLPLLFPLLSLPLPLLFPSLFLSFPSLSLLFPLLLLCRLSPNTPSCAVAGFEVQFVLQPARLLRSSGHIWSSAKFAFFCCRMELEGKTQSCLIYSKLFFLSLLFSFSLLLSSTLFASLSFSPPSLLSLTSFWTIARLRKFAKARRRNAENKLMCTVFLGQWRRLWRR